MINRRKYLYHLVNRSSRAFIISFGVFFAMCGLAFCLMNLKPIFFKGDLLFFAFLLILKNVKRWYNEIITESTFSGFHTIIVQHGLKLGFILFIISEIMLFFGFFWAFFHMALSPDISLGLIWPPQAILVINPLDIPLFNTLLLLLSGFSLTWVHKALANGYAFHVIDGWIITLILGSLFLILQIMEYYESSYSFNDGVYGCTFYMLTGLHGFHVFVGVTFLFICFRRFLYHHFTTVHHLGFIFAAWYWHFVDIVWIFLFLVIYIWGGGIGAISPELTTDIIIADLNAIPDLISEPTKIIGQNITKNNIHIIDRYDRYVTPVIFISCVAYIHLIFFIYRLRFFMFNDLYDVNYYRESIKNKF